jgi:hypothetical protein
MGSFELMGLANKIVLSVIIRIGNDMLSEGSLKILSGSSIAIDKTHFCYFCDMLS